MEHNRKGDIMLFTCLEIFFARILDVSISTFRMMIMVKKKSFITPILAFCEVFIWFIAARKALNTEINSIMIPVCYSLGYATGTYIGGFLSRRFIKNVNTIEVTTKRNNKKLIDTLRKKGLALSVIALKNCYDKPKDMILIEVKSRNTQEVAQLVKSLDEDAFIVIRDTKVVHNGYIK